MARINTNVASLAAQRGLSQSQKMMDETLQRLSSGLQINRGADDPAGLIASETLRSEMSGISQAMENSQRASNVISTAEGSLSEVANLLTSIKNLIVEAANTGAISPDEIAANQLQIDSAVESITRISNTTNFAGLKLLDGGLDYLTSGVDQGVITSLQINQANYGQQPTMPVKIEVVTSAQKAQLFFTQSAVTGGKVTLEVNGVEGVDVLNFVSGTTASSIAFSVNRLTENTGVSARLINSANATSGIVFESAGYGSREYVSINAQSGSFLTSDVSGASTKRDTGRDAVATVNGATTVGDGLNLTANTSVLDLDMTLAEGFGIGQTEFTVTGGGAVFQLGPKITSNQQVNIGLTSIRASNLGDFGTGFLTDIVTGGSKSLVSGQQSAAANVLEKAIRQVAVLRGRLGAFEKNTLETNVNSLSIALENVTASESQIRDADFAVETAKLTRSQILTQAGTSVLAQANSTPQLVLSLLQG
ncbi:MAG: flagellin [Phycisphaerae bacterium]